MLTRFNFTAKSVVSFVFLCVVALIVLNTPVFATDTTPGTDMTVLSMEEMDQLAGGNGVQYYTPVWYETTYPDCWGICFFCPEVDYLAYSTCVCAGSPTSQYCKEEVKGFGWIEYDCGCWFPTCNITGLNGYGGTAYYCDTSGPG